MTWPSPIQGIASHVLRLRRRGAVKIGVDLALVVLAAAWSWFAAFGQVPQPGSPVPFIVAVFCARVPIYLAFRLHRVCWRTVSWQDMLGLAASAALGPPAIALVLFVLPEPFTLRALVRPHLIFATEPALYVLLLCSVRITTRALASSRTPKGPARRIIIAGAGEAGRSLAFKVQESTTDAWDILGFVDDDPGKSGERIRGVPVLGRTSDLPRLARELTADQIVIAIPSLSPKGLREMLKTCEATGVPVRILPRLRELAGGVADPAQIREVRVEDLLPRPEVKLDHEAISRYLAAKTVLVTGGGGSIGKELCRQVLNAGAAQVLVLGRGENSVFEAVQELSEVDAQGEVVPVICDVRDRDALAAVFERFAPEVVFHAAAHKHVPLMEMYPAEAVKNNVFGTLNLVQLAVEREIESFVLVSTDKAVNPSSVMGATKRIAETIVKAYAAENGTSMVSVRFGNVLGSRGSVIPTMQRQIRLRRPVTVTDPDMVRYFMTVQEAVQLTIQAGAIGGRGELFVLNMGHPVRILDLAYDLIRLSGLVPNQDVPVRVSGRRPGEKIREELLTKVERDGAKGNGHFYIAEPQQVGLTTLLAQLERLRMTGEVGENDQLVEMLQEVVPAYQPQARPIRQDRQTQHSEPPASVASRREPQTPRVQPI